MNATENCGVYGAGKGTRTLKLARRNLNPVCLPISSYPHIQFFTSSGTRKTFTEVTAPKSNESTNSTTSAYSFKVQKEKVQKQTCQSKADDGEKQFLFHKGNSDGQPETAVQYVL